ncbi:MAG: hypothetical protein IPQ02_05755 [Saprospiraceae bacterium]|nr:hypothetical protein [Candidatus Defluviibacterium haderslevense]
MKFNSSMPTSLKSYFQQELTEAENTFSRVFSAKLATPRTGTYTWTTLPNRTHFRSLENVAVRNQNQKH